MRHGLVVGPWVPGGKPFKDLTPSFLKLLPGTRGEQSSMANIPTVKCCPCQRPKAMEPTNLELKLPVIL